MFLLKRLANKQSNRSLYKFLENKIPHLINSNEGFTLIELIAVISILSALASLGISNVTKWMKLAKIDEAVVVLNNSLVECLASARSGTDLTTLSPPTDVIDNNRLESTSYIIKTSKDKCADFFITPKNSDENLLFEMGYQINANNNVVKIATPANDQASLIRCKRWAGPNCGASQAQKDAWALAAAIAKAKQECNAAYDSWATGPPPGTTTEGQPQNRWDSSKEPQLTINNLQSGCSLTTYAYKGQIQSSQAVVDQMISDALGVLCDNKVKEENAKKVFGIKQYPDVCGDKTFYLCQGADRQTEVAMNNCQSDYQEEVCTSNKNNARTSGEAKYVGPGGPGICSKTFYFCDDREYEIPADEEAYNKTDCYDSGNQGDGDNGGDNGGGDEEIEYTDGEKNRAKFCLDNMNPGLHEALTGACKYLDGPKQGPVWLGCCSFGPPTFYECMNEFNGKNDTCN